MKLFCVNYCGLNIGGMGIFLNKHIWFLTQRWMCL